METNNENKNIDTTNESRNDNEVCHEDERDIITVNYQLSKEEASIGIKNSETIRGLGAPQIIKTVMLAIVIAIACYNFYLTRAVKTYKVVGVIIMVVSILTLAIIWLVPYFSIKNSSEYMSRKNAKVGIGKKYIYVGEEQDGLIDINSIPQAKSVKGVIVILLNNYKAIFLPERVFTPDQLSQVHNALGIEK